jgi:hypothetical protein
VLLLTAAVLLGTSAPAAAEFSIAINGSLVVTDNGAGDSDPTAGSIVYQGNVAGYDLRITSVTQFSTVTSSDITTSQLLITNKTGTAPITVTITESAFNVPLGATGDSNLFSSFTRNLSEGFGTSGTASMTSTANSQSGGGAATTNPITFTGALGSDATTGLFDRTSEFYSLRTQVTMTGLQVNDVVTLTADSSVTSRVVSPVPAPGSGVLLLGALPVSLGALLLRRRRAGGSLPR